MARWSDAMRLSEYRVWKKDISYPGVYEIGFVRDGGFNPKYIGKASKRIYERIKKHFNEVGSLCVASYYDGRIRDNLYFHVMITENYHSIERNLLRRYKIGKEGGLYEWNRKYED